MPPEDEPHTRIGGGPLSNLLATALDWQECMDLIVASAPLPPDHPASVLIVQRASDAHMALLHAARRCRAMLADIENGAM